MEFRVAMAQMFPMSQQVINDVRAMGDDERVMRDYVTRLSDPDSYPDLKKRLMLRKRFYVSWVPLMRPRNLYKRSRVPT